jgi:hypothetical protein
MYTLAIQTDCYRPNINIAWATDAIKLSTNPADQAAKESYLQFENTTRDFSQGWCQTIAKDDQSNHCYYLDMFGPDVTEESIFHIYYIHRERHMREFAKPWSAWVAKYREQHGITITQQIVQISNPNAGSKCSDLLSYPA